MPEPIVLIGRLEDAEEAEYLAALAAAMLGETVLRLRDASPAQRGRAEIAIVANPDPADVSALPRLVWIHSLWAGVERLVSGLGNAAPPIVRLVDPQMARTMAEAVLAWTMYLQRDMPAYARQQQAKIWRPLAYRKPADTTVGLLGIGALGAAAAKRLRDGGFNVMGWSRSAKTARGSEGYSGERGLVALLAASDIVVCLLPLTRETRGLLDATRLAAMKSGSAIINFARGPIVVTDALLAALDAGHLSHAVLDVFDDEPLPAHSRLWAHPAVTVLPHIAAPTDHASAAAVVAANVRAYRETGVVPRNVDPARGY